MDEVVLLPFLTYDNVWLKTYKKNILFYINGWLSKIRSVYDIRMLYLGCFFWLNLYLILQFLKINETFKFTTLRSIILLNATIIVTFLNGVCGLFERSCKAKDHF